MEKSDASHIVSWQEKTQADQSPLPTDQGKINDNQPQEQTSFPIEVLDTSLTTLSMTSPPNTNVNFGLLFFRELKLWTRYDLWNIYTNCV